MEVSLLVYATAARSHVHSQCSVRRPPFGRPGGRALIKGNGDCVAKMPLRHSSDSMVWDWLV